jgi:N6-adenosine-specific RNA methylase IME4
MTEAELIAEGRRLHREVGLKDTAIAHRLKQTRHWVRKHVGCGFFDPTQLIAATALQPARPLADICVGARARRDNGDIEALARSIDAHGLMHPIVITPSGALIAGRRRMLAWPLTKFGSQDIPVRILDLDEIGRAELAENTDRKDFLPSEIDAIRRALEPIEKAAAKERQGSRNDLRETFPEVDEQRARDKVGAFAGVSGRTVEKIAQVMRAAEVEPEKYGKLAEDMDRTGRVNGPFMRLRNMQAAERITKEVPPLPMQGPYRTIVTDLPWPADLEGNRDPRTRGYYPYPTLTIEEMCALPVASIVHPDGCALWFWITNFHLVRGCHIPILEAWGFNGSTMLSWIKPVIGHGQRLRGASEHCILAIRGDVPALGGSQKTWFEAAAGGEHSAKPAVFYSIVEDVTPAPRYAELFSRGARGPKWDCHGDQIGGGGQ